MYVYCCQDFSKTQWLCQSLITVNLCIYTLHTRNMPAYHALHHWSMTTSNITHTRAITIVSVLRPHLLFNSFLLVCYCQQNIKCGSEAWWTGFWFLSHQKSALFSTRLFHTQCSKLFKLQSIPSALFHAFSAERHQSQPQVTNDECPKIPTNTCIAIIDPSFKA